ncbi:S41 family peptidase [Hymenobacter persicinus]|uniref:Tail specific protease domain-containing protein n=1 Tax=Hymenobacter persicinus TaxID=2025506 RepID=A0A4Q5LB43_9BACT|nr:S41 family peptidase [Hymenobacter persicinus]RYU79314.1 hypothetical protein EWM57_11260 [Hymenobacter persicinus]
MRIRIFVALLVLAGLATGSKPHLSTPERDFETFWRTYHDHYAFFRLHQVDWDQTYATYRPTITARTTASELRETLIKMVQPLQDGHITISDNDRVLYKGTNRRRAYKDQFQSMQEAYWAAAAQALQQAGFAPLRGVGPTVGKFQLLYVSKSSQNVGYLRLSRCFAEMAGVMGTTRQEKADQRQLLALFDQALGELRDCRALIVDVRGNGGGHSGLEMARRFCPARQLTHFVAERQPGGYEQFTALQPYYLTPAPELRYDKPVALLTNDGTASSAEEFVLALHRQPRVTTIGDNTAGMLSDMYQGRLGRKMQFTLSHQRFYAPDTTLLEGVGVPVRVRVPQSREQVIQLQDAVLAQALQTLR